jgi:glycosyl hydrolase family 19 (putative chitinase)
MIDGKYFFDNYPFRPLSQTGVMTINKIFEFYDKDDKYTNLRQLAYVLATAFHESAFTWRTDIREIGRGRGRSYGKTDPVNGEVYYGRGLCQLTWKYNYLKFSRLLNIDLVNNPDLALETDNSVAILMIGMRDGIFTMLKLEDYFNDKITDWVNARRIVNGKDCAHAIAGNAMKFYDALRYIEDDAADEEKDITFIETPVKEMISAENLNGKEIELDGQAYKAVLDT